MPIDIAKRVIHEPDLSKVRIAEGAEKREAWQAQAIADAAKYGAPEAPAAKEAPDPNRQPSARIPGQGP